MQADYPKLVGELISRYRAGLPSLTLTPPDDQLPKKARDEKLKKLEKAAIETFQYAAALAVEGGDESLAKDLVDHFTHKNDGVPAPDDKFKDLLITAEQLTSATRPLGIIVQLYREGVKLSRSDVTKCASFTELMTLVLGTASARL
jgi:hypothetical protein